MLSRKLTLNGEFPATCDDCQQDVQVTVRVAENGVDYASETMVRSGDVHAVYRHDCPGPKDPE
jgi:hypothetical protein